MARPRINPVRSNIGSEEFPLYKYSLDGKTLYVNKNCLHSFDKGSWKYGADIEVRELCFTRKETVKFPSLAKADEFARLYLTTGVDLAKWRLDVGNRRLARV